jgi:hypothetical protein
MPRNESRKAVVKLGREGVSTIVAALRLFQRTYQYCDPEAISADFPEIFTAEHMRFGVVLDPAPLYTDDIDELCEQLGRLDALELKAAK